MSLPSDRLLEEETRGNVSLVRLNMKSLIESNIEPIRTQLLDLAAQREAHHLHLDLGRVEFLTSTGLGLFLLLHKAMRESGGRLSLHNVKELIYEIFSVTRLTMILDVRQEGPEEQPESAESVAVSA